ncbi:uncharacterized protein UHO2_00807 [Ustilago hordei]|uniref:uncharacterized protein n=1 Tax=Ustilago hordei TaxID=120017 RepID=UPI001A5E3A08|nr:uncharacterized protein UHO2_00807 [Ustilago hordei]SYW73942.1 uncharacterized protein UHO2_00807 [Ustilago hordei]
MTKDCKQGLLEFQGDTWQENVMITSTSLLEDVDEDFEQTESRAEISKQQLWHEHLGHPGQDKTRAINNLLKGDNIAKLNPDMAQMSSTMEEPCIPKTQDDSNVSQNPDGKVSESDMI